MLSCPFSSCNVSHHPPSLIPSLSWCDRFCGCMTVASCSRETNATIACPRSSCDWCNTRSSHPLDVQVIQDQDLLYSSVIVLSFLEMATHLTNFAVLPGYFLILKQNRGRWGVGRERKRDDTFTYFQFDAAKIL